MSASTTMTVTIARPVDDVFAVLSDVAKVAIWSSNTIEETLLTPGPLRKGSRRRAIVKGFVGRTMENEAEMVELEQNRRMVVKILDAPVPAQVVIEFTPVDGGTRLDWTGIVSPRGMLAPTAFLIARFYHAVMSRTPPCDDLIACQAHEVRRVVWRSNEIIMDVVRLARSAIDSANSSVPSRIPQRDGI